MQDNTDYLLCVAAEDTTTYHNRQPVGLAMPFSILDVTPPNITTSGNVTCDRYAAVVQGTARHGAPWPDLMH